MEDVTILRAVQSQERQSNHQSNVLHEKTADLITGTELIHSDSDLPAV